MAELKRLVKEGYYRVEDFLEAAGLSLGLATYRLGLRKCFDGWGSFDVTFLVWDFGVGLLGCLGFRRSYIRKSSTHLVCFYFKIIGKGYDRKEMMWLIE